MRLLVRLPTVIAIVALSHPHMGAQSRRPTLPEAARASGGPINRSVDVELRATTVSQLLQEADVIVRGRVGRSHSYLSPDEYNILTDHTIEPIEFIRPTASSFGVRPGVSPPEMLTVTQWGGAILIDGQRVKSEHSALRPLQPGMEAVFLLKRNGDKFGIVRE